ncbi:MAG: DUF3794 domain-containing protein [Tepidibacter sp.]|jgi:hypothetical protein|uniref:DUF3794 domain-containing protein n=1 Tax=Tepidibacter sp. TaxID=2529387 RepID=UPI0025EA56F3|nr:DUF3794 domain-containing protein [Tepidibacter sp.]MCT4508397.1 DUF3794 domain-containing protein [Tepidibacter sp.]
MKNDCIQITGVTPYDHFPNCLKNHPCSQICETDRFFIPKQKPNIHNILQVIADVSVCSFKVICTPLGKKLVIDGTKHIKILYVADDPCQNVHSAHFDIPFCMFILLKDIDCEVIDVFTGIEHISICQLDCRSFTLSMIIFACPIFEDKDKHKHCHSDENCKQNINYNIQIHCNPDQNCNVDYRLDKNKAICKDNCYSNSCNSYPSYYCTK